MIESDIRGGIGPDHARREFAAIIQAHRHLGCSGDDVVGGAVQNISQEAIREFQIVTNRFSAQLGRSGSSVINVVTRSGSNELHGSGSFYFRDSSLQGLPATFDRTLDQSPSPKRQALPCFEMR